MDTRENTTPQAPAQGEPALPLAEVLDGPRGDVRLNLADGWTYAYLRTREAAERFARAVNLHEELVAALRLTVDASCDCEGPNEANRFQGHHCPGHRALAKASAASRVEG